MATYTNKAFNTAVYKNKYSSTLGWLYDDEEILYDSAVSYDYFGTPAIYTNKTFPVAVDAFELLIDDTYELLIDDTYSLEIQGVIEATTYTNKTRNN